jgi:hypothetical protein
VATDTLKNVRSLNTVRTSSARPWKAGRVERDAISPHILLSNQSGAGLGSSSAVIALPVWEDVIHLSRKSKLSVTCLLLFCILFQKNESIAMRIKKMTTNLSEIE